MKSSLMTGGPTLIARCSRKKTCWVNRSILTRYDVVLAAVEAEECLLGSHLLLVEGNWRFKSGNADVLLFEAWWGSMVGEEMDVGGIW